MPINTDAVPVDQYCEGERWCVNGEERLAETLALIQKHKCFQGCSKTDI